MTKPLAIFLLLASIPLCGITETELEAEQLIATQLRTQWAKTDKPMDFPIIIVQEETAIADWLLGNKGGRILLRKEHGQWRTVLYGGSELRFSHRLQRAGINAATSESLSQMLITREKALTPVQKQNMDNFQGIMDLSSTESDLSY